jgi:hypothetical protein
MEKGKGENTVELGLKMRSRKDEINASFKSNSKYLSENVRRRKRTDLHYRLRVVG